MNDAWFTSSDLTQAQLESTASFQSKDLHGVILAGIDVSGWNMRGQNLNGASFQSSLVGTDFTNADLTHAGFYGSAMADAIFTGAGESE